MLKKIKIHITKNENQYIFLLATLLTLVLFYWLFFASDYLKNFLLWLQDFVQNNKEYAYWVAFFSAIVEGTILLGMLPGTTYIVTMGVFMARGDVDWMILFPLVILGAFLGDLIGYSLGKIFSKWLKNKYSQDSNYKFATGFIEKHGGKSIFLARFISGIKEFVPFIAGILRMDFKKFCLWNFFGAIGWSILWLGIGYVGGSLITNIENITRVVGILFLSFFLISSYFYYRKNKDKFHDLDIKF